jgi:hypothetical protein
MSNKTKHNLGLSSNPKNKKEKRQAGNDTILYVPFFQSASASANLQTKANKFNQHDNFIFATKLLRNPQIIKIHTYPSLESFK